MAAQRVATAVIELKTDSKEALAGFERFRSGAKTSMAATEKDARALAAALNSVFGKDLESRALRSVEAIKQVGGATKLTDAEAKAHLHTLDAWIVKARALGRDVSDDILSTRTALQRVNVEAGKAPGLFGSMAGAARSLIGTFGLAFSAGTVLSFAKSLADAAGDIIDLSNKTGLTTDSIQRMQHVAKLTGAELGNFTDAAFKLGVNLSRGGDSVVGAVEKLGLKWSELKSLSMDQQFELIAQKLGEVENAQDRNRIAVDLFGKGAAPILAAIAEGYRKLADSANVAKREQLDALDEAADAWDDFVERQKKTLTAWLGNQVIARDQVAKLNAEQQAHYYALLKSGGDAQKYLLELAAQQRAAEVKPSAGKPAAAPLSIDYAAEIAKARAEIDKLTKSQREGIEAARLYGASNEEITDQYKISELALRLLDSRTKEVEAGQRKHAETVRKGQEQFRALRGAIDASTSSLKLFNGQLPGTKVNVSTLLDFLPKVPELSGGVRTGFETPRMGPLDSLPGIRVDISKLIPASTPTLLQRLLGDPAQFSHQLTQVVLGAVQAGQNPVAAGGAMLGSSLMGGLAKHLTTARDGASALLSGWIGGAANAVLPFVGSLVGPLVNAVFGAFRDEQHERVNDLRDEFLKQFGPGGTGAGSGFHTLAAQLHELGAAGDALFQRLINAKKVEEFQAAMAAVQEALANSPSALAAAAGYKTREELQQTADKAREVYEFVRDSGKYSAEVVEDAYRKMREAQIAAMDDAQRAAFDANQKVVDGLKKQLEDLNAEYEQLFKAVQDEAPEEVMGVVEQAQRARMAAIEQERKAVQAQLEEANLALEESMNRVADAMDRVADALRNDVGGAIDSLDGRKIRIDVEYNAGDVPTPNGAAAPVSRGGYVTTHGVQYFASGGLISSIFKSRGTDTVPAMLTPGEGVLNRMAMRRIGVATLHQLNAGRAMPQPVPGNGAVSVSLGDINIDARGAVMDSSARVEDLAEKLAMKIPKKIEEGGIVRTLWQRQVGAMVGAR